VDSDARLTLEFTEPSSRIGRMFPARSHKDAERDWMLLSDMPPQRSRERHDMVAVAALRAGLQANP